MTAVSDVLRIILQFIQLVVIPLVLGILIIIEIKSSPF